jgi:hypothetical protein
MLAHVDTARLAHRALRLRENGIDSEAKLRQLAGRALADEDTASLDEAIIGSPGAHPLGQIALATYDFTDDERPGPTDPKAVEKLLSSDLGSIWKAWDEATTANVESLLEPAELKRWRKANADALRAFEDRVAAMQETGDFAVHPYFGHLRHTDGAANALYDLGRQGFLDGSIDFDTAAMKVALVDSAVYTVNLATHQFMSSVASVVAATAALTTKTVAAGVADADDLGFGNTSGAQSEALILYQSSAVGGGADVASSAQRLIGYIDTATGLPVTPNGGPINIVWDSGSNRIFKL